MKTFVTRFIMPLAALVLWVACESRSTNHADMLAPEFAKAGGDSSGGDPTVTSTDPPGAPRDTTLDVKVFGSGYDRGSRVDFGLDAVPSSKVTTNSTRFVSQSQLVANITIAPDAVEDLYDVIVTTSKGKRGIGTELFAIKGGNPANREAYTLEFSGDIIARDVPATAFPGDIWGSLEIKALVDVTLPAPLVPENDKPFYQVNWPPPEVLDLDPSTSYLYSTPPYCTYSEKATNALRWNSWGANAGLWPDTKVTVAKGSGPNPGARIDLEQPALKPGQKPASGTPRLVVAAQDADAVISGSTLQFIQGQALVSAGSVDPHTDPCISVTITATPAP